MLKLLAESGCWIPSLDCVFAKSNINMIIDRVYEYGYKINVQVIIMVITVVTAVTLPTVIPGMNTLFVLFTCPVLLSLVLLLLLFFQVVAIVCSCLLPLHRTISMRSGSTRSDDFVGPGVPERVLSPDLRFLPHFLGLKYGPLLIYGHIYWVSMDCRLGAHTKDPWFRS